MDIIRHKWIFLSFSALLVAVSIYGIVAFGLQKGIDFTGGTLWQVAFHEPVERAQLVAYLREDANLPDVVVIEQENGVSFNIRTKEIGEVDHQRYAAELRRRFGAFDELSFQTIGAAIGSELVSKAFWALGVNLFAISLYIAYAFRKVSRPVSSWKYALITLITLFHDSFIPLGMMAFLGHYLGVEIDTNFIVAILIVIGFSVHDTIVVFDRIRENLRRGGVVAGGQFAQLVNTSVRETFARSVNTSLTLIVVLAALLILGSGSLYYFILTILVGTIVGTYSSIFVASHLLVVWNRDLRK